MAETKLMIERKVDELENQTQRNTRAISTMAQWLVQAQTGFGAQDAQGIEKILRGENDASQEDEGRVSVRDEGEAVQGQGSESEGSEAGQSDQGQSGEE